MTLPKFNHPQLLKQALTHRSAVNEKRGYRHNERMEFLGDAVLEIVVSEFLYFTYKNKPEGELTKLRTALVRTETLSSVARDLGLTDKILMSRGERNQGGNKNQSLLADTMEAVIGAVYLDQGWDGVKKFIKQALLANHQEQLKTALSLDAKSQFQELVQGKKKPTPTYKIINIQGPDHDRIFTAAALVGKTEMGRGTGDSKQEAEQAAARDGLKRML